MHAVQIKKDQIGIFYFMRINTQNGQLSSDKAILAMAFGCAVAAPGVLDPK
jgi:hypothetical protein